MKFERQYNDLKSIVKHTGKAVAIVNQKTSDLVFSSDLSKILEEKKENENGDSKVQLYLTAEYAAAAIVKAEISQEISPMRLKSSQSD